MIAVSVLYSRLWAVQVLKRLLAIVAVFLIRRKIIILNGFLCGVKLGLKLRKGRCCVVVEGGGPRIRAGLLDVLKGFILRFESSADILFRDFT